MYTPDLIDVKVTLRSHELPNSIDLSNVPTDEMLVIMENGLARIVQTLGSDATKYGELASTLEAENRHNFDMQRNRKFGMAVLDAIKRIVEANRLDLVLIDCGYDYDVYLDGVEPIDAGTHSLKIADYLMEVKATTTGDVNLTMAQARTASEQKSRFILCVVDFRGITAERMASYWNVEDIESRTKVFCGIGDLIQVPSDFIEEAKLCPVGIRNENTLRYGVPPKIWENGSSISDWLMRLHDRLDLNVALSYLADPKLVDLSNYISIDDDAAEALSSKCLVTLNLKGLTSLSDTAAEALSKHMGGINLDGLTCLSDAAAESLSKHSGDIKLNGLTCLSDAAAEALSKHSGDIKLNGLTCLSDVATVALFQHYSCTNIDGLTNISETAISLMPQPQKVHEYMGWLSLNGLNSLSAEAAELLSMCNRGLYLDGLKNLSEAAAVALSQSKKGISLNGLTSLSEAAAAALSQSKKSISLNGLTSLSDKVAESLFQKGIFDQWICLNGLTSISDEVAKSLTKKTFYRVYTLYLNGLTSLSDAVAAALSSFRGHIALNGINSLSDAAAAALTQNKWSIELDGLTSISDTVAESLSHNHMNSVSLNGLSSLSVKTAKILLRPRSHHFRPRALSFNGLTSLGDETAHALSNHWGYIELNGLTSLSNDAAQSLSQLQGSLSLMGLTSLSKEAFEVLSNRGRRCKLPTTDHKI
jgi:hypothetical protein